MATMRLSDAVEGFLMFKAVDCSKHTLKDYDNTFRKWLAFLEDDPPSERFDRLRNYQVTVGGGLTQVYPS